VRLRLGRQVQGRRKYIPVACRKNVLFFMPLNLSPKPKPLAYRQCALNVEALILGSVFRILKNRDVFVEAYRDVFTAVLKTLPRSDASECCVTRTASLVSIPL
jgi:hypothetical protein